MIVFVLAIALVLGTLLGFLVGKKASGWCSRCGATVNRLVTNGQHTGDQPVAADGDAR